MTYFSTDRDPLSNLISLAAQANKEEGSKEGKVATIRKALLGEALAAKDISPVKRREYQTLKSNLVNIQKILSAASTVSCDPELHREVRQHFHGDVKEALTDLTESFEEIVNGFEGSEREALSKIVEGIKKSMPSGRVAESVSGVEGLDACQEKISKIREKVNEGLTEEEIIQVKKELASVHEDLQNHLEAGEDYREHVLAEDLEVLSLDILDQEVQLAFPCQDIGATYRQQQERIKEEVKRIRETYELNPSEPASEEIQKLEVGLYKTLDNQLLQEIENQKEQFTSLHKASTLEVLLSEYNKMGKSLLPLIDSRPEFIDRDTQTSYLAAIGDLIEALNKQFIVKFASLNPAMALEANELLKTENKAIGRAELSLVHLSILFKGLELTLSSKASQERLSAREVDACFRVAQNILASLAKVREERPETKASLQVAEKASLGTKSVVTFVRGEPSGPPSKVAAQASRVETVFQNVVWSLPHIQLMLFDLATTYLITGGVDAADVTYSLGYIALIAGSLQISKRLPEQYKWLMPYVTWGLSISYYLGIPYAKIKLREMAADITADVNRLVSSYAGEAPAAINPGFALSGHAHGELEVQRLLPTPFDASTPPAVQEYVAPPEFLEIQSMQEPKPLPTLSGRPHGELESERVLPTYRAPKRARPLLPIPPKIAPGDDVCRVPNPYEWGEPARVFGPEPRLIQPAAPEPSVEQGAKASRSWFSIFWGK